jgi:hypothetical protein
MACKVYAFIESLPPEPGNKPIKLTPCQRDFLMNIYAGQRPSYPRGGALGDFAGTPIELVDDEADSTLGATFPQVASANPQVAYSGQKGWLGRWLHRMRRTR